MSSRTSTFLIGGGLVIAAAVVYLVFSPAEQAPAPPVTVAPEPAPAPAPATPPNLAGGPIEPAVRFPLPVVEEPGESIEAPASIPPDPATGDALLGPVIAELFGARGLGGLIVVQDLVRRIVVTVDNLPGEQMPWARSPIRRAEGSFQVAEGEDGIRIAEENAARYLPYVQLAEVAGGARLVAAYVRAYPLFQAAYDELGYPGAYFNDRLVSVIDHMLAAPEPTGAIRLVQPKVRYRFEDPALQQASAGHKIMLRMGTDNARRVKTVLRDIRQRLTAAAPRG